MSPAPSSPSPALPATRDDDRDLKARLARELEAVRRRSLDLVGAVADSELTRQISPIMSPLVWDLAHVGNYEDLWLVRAAAGAPPVAEGLDDLYDAFRHPRPNRPALPLLGPPEARSYIAEVRSRVLDLLDAMPLDDGNGLVSDGFVHGMVIQHEHQHDETMLATLQLRDGDALFGPGPDLPPGRTPVAEEVWVAPGPFLMGTDTEAWAYDNERPAHVVDVDGFFIDAAPVTNLQYQQFMADGGYHRPELWTDEGWAWRQEAGLEHPQFWEPQGEDTWARRAFGVLEPVAHDHPVIHVCAHEADAYARWAGKRLPTEAEWEKAASWSPAGTKRRYPWGDEDPDPHGVRANLGQRWTGTTPVGSHPTGVSAYGCHQMVGDVWEWTSSEFSTYPGFTAFPYAEYSAVFSGAGYRVLRGGSWATSPVAVRNTFRNWDHPIRRQIFAGFRCARGPR